jgi:hypothetical protein
VESFNYSIFSIPSNETTLTTTTTMAPNIQHHIHLLSAGPRPRSILLSAGATAVKVAPYVGKDYQRSIPVADSATYWLWESPKDLFSAEHIVTTAIRSATSEAVVPTHQQHDDRYWAEASYASASPSSTLADYYWDEHSHCSSSAVEAHYWAEVQAPRHFGGNDDEEEEEEAPRLQQSSSYWDEVNHLQLAVLSLSSDDYWREEQSQAVVERHYWDWSSSSPTSSRDRYWVM